MGESYIVVRVIHIIAAAIWIGAAFFFAWFLMPALQDAGPEGGKVMMAVQKRGWVVAFPLIATLTVLSGFWLYRPYMGNSGHAAALLGYGGVIGVIALALGAGVVSRSMVKATDLMSKAGAMPDGPDRAATVESARRYRQRALTFIRIVSVLVILAATLMAISNHV